MKGLSAIVPATLAAMLLLPAASHGDDSQIARVPAARISDRMLDALVEANGVPGMGAAVVREGETVWVGSAGLRDVEQGLRVDKDTRFRLASVSKVLTATAAARLKERGALDVDASVQSLLPWLAADWQPLTSRQLAAHISGMPHYQAQDEGRGGVHYASVRDAVGLIRTRELLTPPGTAYEYSSWGYTLLSAVIEARAGVPFLDYVHRDLAAGLAIGPDATYSGDVRAARAYAFVDGTAVPAPRHDFSYTWGGGGLGATPEAIAQFGARVMSGDVVSPATLEWMLTPTPMADGSAARERDFEVGFGWRVSKDADNARIAHHAGVTEGARSALVLWPERKLGASVLSNALWVSSIEQTAILLAAPFQAEADRPRLPERACPSNVSTYRGQFEGAVITGSARFDREEGVCIGTISLPAGPLREWLNVFPQRDAESLRIVGLDQGGGLSRAALVTPIGLHDLRAQPEEGGYLVRFGGSRSLTLQFQ